MTDLYKLFSEATFVQQMNVETVLANGTLYPASGSFIDMRGFYRGIFVVAAGAIAAQQTFQVQQAIAVNGTPKDLTGAVVVVPATGDNKTYLVEFGTDQLDVNNDYRYVTLKDTGGGVGDYAAILFLGYGRNMPVSQPASFGDAVELVG